MQKGKIFVFAVAVAAVFGGAYAGDDNAAALLLKKTVASKKYVDDTFQTKIAWDQQTGVDPDLSLVGVNMQHAIVPDITVPLTLNAEALPIQSSMFGGDITSWNSSRDGRLNISIPSIQFVGELLQYKLQYKQNTVPAAVAPLGVVLMPTDTEGELDYRFIIPGLDMTVEGPSIANYNVRNWALFGGTMSNNEVADMLDDISRQLNPDMGWADDSAMSLNDVLYAPASLKLVSDVWNESQRTITAHAANAADSVLTDSATAGVVQKRAIYDGSATYAAGTHGTQIPTMAGVAAYVDTHSPTIPAPTGDCLNTANHCALVTTYANGTISYSWTVMAK